MLEAELSSIYFKDHNSQNPPASMADSHGGLVILGTVIHKSNFSILYLEGYRPDVAFISLFEVMMALLKFHILKINIKLKVTSIN